MLFLGEKKHVMKKFNQKKHFKNFHKIIWVGVGGGTRMLWVESGLKSM